MAALSFIGLSATATSAQAACKDATTGGLSVAPTSCTPFKKARIINGQAVAPQSAPLAVKRVIAAANQIRLKKYVYGGGHARPVDPRGYDCSGSVSYALRGGKLMTGSMPSYGFYNWEAAGKGKWITIYTKNSHMYMVVAGLSFDTSNMSSTGGNRWSSQIRSPAGFKVRHPRGL